MFHFSEINEAVERYSHGHLYSSIILNDSNVGSNPKITTATESMIVVISDFVLLLKINFINYVQATIIINAFQLHFT